MKKSAFVLMCVCLAISMPSFADETIVYVNDYNNQTPGDTFNEGGPWSWGPDYGVDQTVTYEDDGTGNIVIHQDGYIDNSLGTEALDARFGTQWGLTMSGNTSPDPADYIIEFDIRSVSGNWDPIALEFFVLTNNQGYGSGPADYNQADGWVHVSMSLADLTVNWWAGQDWDLTLPDWRIEVGGPPYPGTSVPAGTPAWNQIWEMDNLKITQISAPSKSYDPDPQDGAINVKNDTILSWTPGVYADKHDVYLGTDFNDVNDANRANDPGGVLVSQNQSASQYPEIGTLNLALGTTYYWRIDDVNDPNIYKGSVWSFTTANQYLTDTIIYQNDYNSETIGNGFPAWNWFNPDTGEVTHTATYQDDGTGNIVVDHNGLIDNSGGTEAVNCRFGSKWGITVSGNKSSNPEDYTIEFDLHSVSGNWNPIALEFFVLTGTGNGVGYGSGASNYSFANGVVHVSKKLSELNVGWWNGTNWDLTDTAWQIEVGGPPYPGTSVPAGTPAWNQIWTFDNLKITETVGVVSFDPNPPDGATRVEFDPTLSWTPGPYSAKHDIYLGTDFNSVNDANRINQMGILLEQDYDANSYAPGILQWNTTYYWRIDDVNDPNIFKGSVWSFTTRDPSIIDDFESYTDTGFPRIAGTLRNTWIDGYYGIVWPSTLPLDSGDGKSGAWVQLASDPCDGTTNSASPALDGDKSMKFYYDNDGTITWLHDLYKYDAYYTYVAPMYSEAIAAIVDAGRISTNYQSRRLPNDFSGYKLLKVGYYGDPTNTVVASDKLYVTLQDADGTTVTIYNPDQTIIQQPGWHNWYIKMSDFASNPSLDLTNITRIYIGIGNKSSPVSGGTGVIFLDEIKLLSEGVCIPGSVNGDFDDDCTIGPADLQRMTELWLGQPPAGASPIISLDASGLSLGTLTSWSNGGTEGGVFEDYNSLVTGYKPTVQMVEGVKAVVFDGNDVMRADFNAPATITGSHAFTVIYKVLNLAMGPDEEIFCWAKRGTNNRYAAACYGAGTAWSAGAFWGPADVGFGRGSPAAHTWHTIGLTYEGGTDGQFYVITDGQVNTSVTRSLDLWPDCQMTIGAAYNADPYITTDLGPGYWFSGALAKLDVYDYYMTAGQLAMKMGTPVNLKNDSIIDFKDVAVLANKWLTGPILFGD